jgi:hypothetical protein
MSNVVFLFLLLIMSARLCDCTSNVGLWNNCTSFPQFNTIECSSLNVLNSSHVFLKVYKRSGYVFYRYFKDSSLYDLCSDVKSDPVFQELNISSCEQYWCDSDKGNVTINSNTSRAIVIDHSFMLNYCQYCRREDFETFQNRVFNGSCPAFKFPNPSFCSGYEKGYPLVFDSAVQILNTPYICQCQSGKFAYKCDFFSLVWSPLLNNVFPFFVLAFLIMMAMANFVLYLFPFLYIRTKYLVQNREDYKQALFMYFDTYLLITSAIQIYLVFAIFETIFNLPYMSITMIRRYFLGDGFFRATSFIFLLVALFTLLTLWIHVMRIARSINNQEVMEDRLSADLKVVLVIIFILLAALFVIPFFSLISTPRYHPWVNRFYLPLTCVSGFVLSLGFAIYGTRLYLKMREIRDIGFFEVKFTRFASIVIILLLLLAIQMLFVIIEWLRSGGPTFGVVYRSLNFSMISLNNLLIALAVMYQTLKPTLIAEAYPFLPTCLRYMCCDRFRKRVDGYEEEEQLVRY